MHFHDTVYRLIRVTQSDGWHLLSLYSAIITLSLYSIIQPIVLIITQSIHPSTHPEGNAQQANEVNQFFNHVTGPTFRWSDTSFIFLQSQSKCALIIVLIIEYEKNARRYTVFLLSSQKMCYSGEYWPPRLYFDKPSSLKSSISDF